MAKNVKESKENSTQTVEEKIASIKEKMAELSDKNVDTNFITTKSGIKLPDEQYKAFEKKYSSEMDRVSMDYEGINKVLYKRDVKDNESPIIDEMRDYLIKTYFNIERDDFEFWKAVKGLFKALRVGKLNTLEKQLEALESKEKTGVTVKE